MSSGKWSQPGVPHKGWQFQGIEDLGELSGLCQMCETQAIRYVHYMKHIDYEDTLGVGCVCAERMEENYSAPKEREKQAKLKAARRVNWMRRNWKRSAKGNAYINHMGFNIVLYRRATSWAYQITHRNYGDEWRHSGFRTENDAKLAAFEKLEELR